MKILWIEDFGGGLPGSKVAIEMFSGMIPKEIFDREHDEDEDITRELPRLFQGYTWHQLHICKSYLEWKENYEEHLGDFDAVIIDINLEKYKTPKKAIPKGLEPSFFDQKAGFHIYHQFIKSGFPDDNIAFFTGEPNTLKEFAHFCGLILVDIPKHTFEKSPVNFKKLRTWLHEREQSQYINLRRGIIEGCRFLKEELENIDVSELEQRLLFYKTTRLRIDLDPDAYRTEVIEYLGKLQKTILPLRQPENLKQVYLIFVKELVEKWEMSGVHFRYYKEIPQSESRLEERFYKTCQSLMKTLRNWTLHNQLTTDLREKEVAYFFMLAMRSWVQLSSSQIYQHETILSHLFSMLSEQEMDIKMELELEVALKTTYTELYGEFRSIQDLPDFNKEDNYFLGLLRDYGKMPINPNYLDNFSKNLRSNIQNRSIDLFYQSFWHGLFPAWKDPDSDYRNPTVNFNIEPIPPSTFLHFLGRMIFKEAFKIEQ